MNLKQFFCWHKTGFSIAGAFTVGITGTAIASKADLIVKTPTDILLFQICTFMLTFIAYLLILLINSDNKEQSNTKKVK